MLKTTFTPGEVSALRQEALDKSSTATKNVPPGGAASLQEAAAGDPTVQTALPRAGHRRRKTISAGASTAPFVHPEPTPSKKQRTAAAGSTGSTGGNDNPAAAAAFDEASPAATDAEKMVDEDPAGEVRVGREYGVADKKGQRHQIFRPRTVSTSFGQACVDAYLALVISALSQKMEDLGNGAPPNKCPDGGISTLTDVGETTGSGMTVVEEDNGGGKRRAAEKEEVVGVISYTEELSKNVVRTGVPPPLPKYTKVAMWRGEDVCLNQLGAGDMKELMVGIAWCQPKGPTPSIDLDLSVMVS